MAISTYAPATDSAELAPKRATDQISDHTMKEEPRSSTSGSKLPVNIEESQNKGISLANRPQRKQLDCGLEDGKEHREISQPSHTYARAKVRNKLNPRSVSAAPKVFKHAQLLEHILLSVDLHTLLHSTEVARSFMKTIISSPSLRQRLWIDTPPRFDKSFEPRMNPFLTHFRSNLAINAWIKQEYNDGSTNYILRFGPKEHLLMLRPGTWRDMIVFRPNSKAGGVLMLRVETMDTPCVYDIFSVKLEWNQTIKMGVLVDMLVAEGKQ